MKDLDEIIIEIRESTYDNGQADTYKRVITTGDRVWLTFQFL